MKNSFAFRQFVVAHDRCAMKVGTDGVLLGAWAGVTDAARILDVGCGSGLIALMAAQRSPRSRVWGIDVDEPSLSQALENVRHSPFASRVQLSLHDVRSYAPGFQFDHVLCNPPFYTEDTLPPDAARMRARHTAGLTLESLLAQVDRLLCADGLFSLILPSATGDVFLAHALSCGWYVVRSCRVHTVAHKPPKRVLFTLSRTPAASSLQEELVLQDKDGKRTTAYSALCADFYLRG